MHVPVTCTGQFAVLSFLPDCGCNSLAFVRVLAGSSGSHMGGGLKNSRNVSQLLTTLHSLPVTCPCDFLQNYVKRSVVGGQQHSDSVAEDFWVPAVVLRGTTAGGWGTDGSQWSQLAINS